MDCNRCEYLNITEDEQREMGNKKGHYCKKYNKPVYHWGSDYCLHPVKECDREDELICILDDKGSVLSYYRK